MFAFRIWRSETHNLIARRAYNDEPTIMTIDAVFLSREKSETPEWEYRSPPTYATGGRRNSPRNTGSWIRERSKHLRAALSTKRKRDFLSNRRRFHCDGHCDRQGRQSSSEASVTSNETSLSIEKRRSKLSYDCFCHCTTILMIDL